MEFRVAAIALISWCLLAGICECINVEKSILQASDKRQLNVDGDELGNEVLTWTSPKKDSVTYLSQSENVDERFKNYFLLKFLKQQENNVMVKRANNVSGFIDELQSLEDRFNSPFEKVDLLPFYQSLLKRISEHSKHITDNLDPSLYKKILRYLYTATLGRIRNLEDELESNLIIDISAYLDSVESDIAKLKDLQNAEIKDEILNKYKQKYKKEIDAKIKETSDIISKLIIPEVGNIAKETDEQVNPLINNVTHLKREVDVEHKLLNKTKQELEMNLLLQNSVSSLKMFGSVIRFLSLVGNAASSIIGIEGTETGSSIFQTAGSLHGTETLAEAITDLKSSKNIIKDIRDLKVDTLRTSLENIYQEANKYPDRFSDITLKVTDFKSRLNKISGENIMIHHLTEIQDLEIELKTALETKYRESLETQNVTIDQRIKNESAVIQGMLKAVMLSSSILGSHKKYYNDQDKLDTLNDAIQQNDEKFRKLKQFENDILDTLVPMLQIIQNDIDCLINNFPTKSEVDFDVAQWKVKRTLEDVMIQMQKLTEEFKGHSKLIRCIDKMRESILTLIIVYEHIRDFQKDQIFSNSNLVINSITVSNKSPISNTIFENNLKNALNNLEIMVRSSIIFQRYRVAIHAFKQYVFPFAVMYINGFELKKISSYLNLHVNTNNDELANLVYRTLNEIKDLKRNLRTYKFPYAITEYDTCSYTGDFNSEYDSIVSPFFVWRNIEHKNMISKLLSGDTVLVKADVSDSPSYKGLIKFLDLNIHFKAKDEGKQSEINKALKKFRIYAVHLGNSYYRYKNRTYLRTTRSKAILRNEEPIKKEKLRDLFKIKYDFILSPYAYWEITLHSLGNDNSFSDLEMYKDEVDLVLGGEGSYYSDGERYCLEIEMKKYYKAIYTYNNGSCNFQATNL